MKKSIPLILLAFICSISIWFSTRMYETGKGQNELVRITLSIKDINNNIKEYTLEEPVSAARSILLEPETVSSNAFNLPLLSSSTVEFENVFTGDVDKGGSCNVDLLSYVPHNVTHFETSAHILSKTSEPVYVNEIPQKKLSGIAYLIDLSDFADEPDSLIPRNIIEKELINVKLPVKFLAIKTGSSLLPENYDFSGKDYLALSPEAAEYIHNFSIMCGNLSQNIEGLILDLP
ncbi:cyclase family protein, partial [candidate division KSB1 bacterium]